MVDELGGNRWFRVYSGGRRFIAVAVLAMLLSGLGFAPGTSLRAEDGTQGSSPKIETVEISPDFAKYDFTLKSLDGVSKVHLGDVIKKNYAVVVFWSARCPVCDFAMPYVKLFDEFIGEKEIKDIKVITVALDARAEEPLSVAVDKKYGFEILHDPMGRDTDEPYLLDKKGIPACYVFNKEGYIIATVYGFDKKFINSIQDAINADRQSHGGARSRPNKVVE